MESVEWVDPDGVVTPLRVEFAVRGRFAPPVEFDEDTLPGQAGAVVRQSLHGVREMTVPILVSRDTAGELRTALRDLTFAMDPNRGDGVLRVTTPLGDVRELVCRVSGGMGVDEILGETATPTDQRIAVVVRAVQPYWQATSDTAFTFTTGEAPSFFPFFPLRLTSSEVFAENTIDNTGDVQTWPVWTVQGPGAVIVLDNLTTGEKIELSRNGGLTLGIGESLIVDTREQKKTLTLGDGTNAFRYVSHESSLWALQKGMNTVRVQMSSSDSNSSVDLRFRPRYLTT